MADETKELKAALAEIEKAFGKGSIMAMGDMGAGEVECIPTGSLSLDIALGGRGVPRGRVVEIYGNESSGKTTIALHIIAQAQKLGGVAAFIDAEHALDPTWAKKVGVNLENLLVAQPGHGEEALKICEMLVRSGAIDLIVIDSVAALVPKNEIEGDIGDSHVGLQARLMSQALRILTPAINRSKTCVVFINQIRQKIGVMFGNPETTTGGLALKFYASVRMEVRRGQPIKIASEEDAVGSEVKVKVVKNKIAPPFRTAEFELMYDRGISVEGDVLKLSEEAGLLTKSGANFYHGEQRIGNGKENARNYLREHPELVESLKTQILEKKGMLANAMATDPEPHELEDGEQEAIDSPAPASKKRK